MTGLGTLEEKIDQILKYQKSAQRWAMMRGITSFLFFLIFVILPAIASFYLVGYLQKNVDWSKFGDMKAQFEQLQNMSSEFKNFGEMMNPEKSKIPNKK